MQRLRFDRCGRVNGETVYNLSIDGKIVRERLTLEEVMAELAKQEEEEQRRAEQ